MIAIFKAAKKTCVINKFYVFQRYDKAEQRYEQILEEDETNAVINRVILNITIISFY